MIRLPIALAIGTAVALQVTQWCFVALAAGATRPGDRGDTGRLSGAAYQARLMLAASEQNPPPESAQAPHNLPAQEAPTMALRSDKPLRLGGIAFVPVRPVAGRLLTVHVELEGTWDTPFWQEQVALDAGIRGPGGRSWRVPGFYSAEYSRSRGYGSTPETEVLTTTGRAGWYVRFLPPVPGAYELTLAARDRSGMVSESATFRVEEGEAASYVRVSRRDPHYFELTDGTPYFANGLNLCWYNKGGTYDYDRWFGALAEAGGNYARIWMPEWAFAFEWGKPGEYRLDRAWQMDYVLALAERKGIRIKLCLENFRKLDGDNPYSAGNGGPCRTVMDVFTSPEAKRMFRNRLRYAVARWGYSTSLMAWEFWNEINCVDGYDAPVVRAWTAEMADYLRSIDPYHHLVVNSLGSFVFEPELWSMPQIDFAQMHGYWHPSWESTESGKDMARMVADQVARIRAFKKPALFAEFGLVDENWGPSPRMKDDPQGLHLHNGMWAAIMAGAAGTAHLWWWDSYVEPRKLWSHFRGVASFIRDVRWANEGFRPFAVANASSSLRVTGLRGRSLVLLWAQNAAHTWWNVAEKKRVPQVKDAQFILRELPSGARTGTYVVEVWDTYTGELLSSQNVTIGDKGLPIRLGSLAKDVAVKVRPTATSVRHAEAQAHAPDVVWQKSAANPVLGGELGTCFDVSVLKEGGLFRMWFSWRPKHSIALVESHDGVHWGSPTIVLSPNAESGWEDDVNRPSVIHTPDGYHMWYTGQAGGHSYIGHAVSQDGITWRRVQRSPVLSPEEPWEKVAVMCPHVIWDGLDRIYRMWYSGGEQYEPDAIGYATSLDGNVWAKHPTNPIFVAEKANTWERHKVTACQVVRDGEWYVMLYIGFRDQDHAQIGMARSRDGVVSWERCPTNPIIRPGRDQDAWDSDAVYKPFALYDEGEWLLWYNGRRGSTEQIGLAVRPAASLWPGGGHQ